MANVLKPVKIEGQAQITVANRYTGETVLKRDDVDTISVFDGTTAIDLGKLIAKAMVPEQWNRHGDIVNGMCEIQIIITPMAQSLTVNDMAPDDVLVPKQRCPACETVQPKAGFVKPEGSVQFLCEECAMEFKPCVPVSE